MRNVVVDKSPVHQQLSPRHVPSVMHAMVMVSVYRRANAPAVGVRLSLFICGELTLVLLRSAHSRYLACDMQFFVISLILLSGSGCRRCVAAQHRKLRHAHSG